MDKAHYEEMCENLDSLLQKDELVGKNVYLFGHCNATETLANQLLEKGISVCAILDNNERKHGKSYRNIPIEAPREILSEAEGDSAVCIAARAYESMAEQLRSMGYMGQIHKMVEYDSFAEYSLSEDTMRRKRARLERGLARHRELTEGFPGYMKILCPFQALGDICFAMSYLPHFLDERGIRNCAICVVGQACAQVVKLFGDYPVEVLPQKAMDEVIQAALYTNDRDSFIAHQDRPYVVDLHRALYVKCIPLEQIYCCGVYGLPRETEPVRPSCWKPFHDREQIQKGKAVILSPYAKSVVSLPDNVWSQIVEDYAGRGFQCFTNVAGEETPLEGTLPIRSELAEMQPLVEYAGTFIGIRSGLCDVLRYADCRKIALYPDYNYCDTQWKAIDMYALDGWENIVVKDDFVWKKR